MDGGTERVKEVRPEIDSVMAGWIKISKDIAGHWLWDDAERLKWWLDLLFMAAWEDKKVLHDSHLLTLQRGQVIASISFLAERWEKSEHTVIKFLRLLEGEEMIKREVLHRQTAIITICNYNRYQQREDIPVQGMVQGMVQGNKEIKEYISTTTTARAREDEEKKLVEEIKEDAAWCGAVARRYGFGSAEVARARFEEFALDMQCKGRTHKDLTDAKRHFNDWLRKEKEKSEKYEFERRKYEARRGNLRVTAKSADDYSTTF